jgi:hypothetical protein
MDSNLKRICQMADRHNHKEGTSICIFYGTQQLAGVYSWNSRVGRCVEALKSASMYFQFITRETE